MNTMVCTLDRKGNLSLLGALEDLEIVLIRDDDPDRRLTVENIALRGMTLPDMHAHICDNLSHELQTGRLSLVRLNHALKMENTQ